jgi:hypothetical protein
MLRTLLVTASKRSLMSMFTAKDSREVPMRTVVQALSGRDFGDGDVFRACAAAAKLVMWNVTKEES